MKFEVSEQVRTETDIATIIYALFAQLDKVSAKSASYRRREPDR
jgi:hypothetical protein